MTLESKIPAGDIATKWTQYKSTVPLVNPANKRQLEIIVVGTGLAGASAAATLAEMGYKVKAFCFQDSPRRAHSIAAQGGINAAKKTIKTTVTLSTVYSMIPSKVVTTVPAKPTCIAWQNVQLPSSTNAWLKGFPSPVNTAEHSRTALSVVPKCSVRFTRPDKQASSCCLVPTAV